MASEAILESANRFVEKTREQGIPIEAVYLFGSWAKDRASEYSDIDLAIVSTAFEGVTFYDRRKLDRAVIAVDTAIEPPPLSPRRLQRKRSFRP